MEADLLSLPHDFFSVRVLYLCTSWLQYCCLSVIARHANIMVWVSLLQVIDSGTVHVCDAWIASVHKQTALSCICEERKLNDSYLRAFFSLCAKSCTLSCMLIQVLHAHSYSCLLPTTATVITLFGTDNRKIK